MESCFFIFLFLLIDLQFFSVYLITNFNRLVELLVSNEPFLLFNEFAEPRRCNNIAPSGFAEILVLFLDELGFFQILGFLYLFG